MAYQRDYYLAEMERLYARRPYSDIEMAERLGTSRSNVWKMRQRMEGEWGLYEAAPGRYRSDPLRRINQLRLNASETVALYLAGRRLQQQTRTQQRDVASALEKLAMALRRPLEEALVGAAQQVLAQEEDPRQSHVLHELVEAWLQGYRVRITHRVLHGEPREYLVSPYHLEPSPWGDALYLIGQSDYHGGLATFKVARIEGVTRTTDFFEIPETFDAQALLRHAWGVWHSEGEPVTVRLRFTPYAAPRVRETIWHPSQEIIPQADGGLIWQVPVAEWREMAPWVRGWGSDVEVLEPEDLREEVKRHVVYTSRQYGLQGGSSGGASVDERLLQLWGKSDRQREELYHPALYHMFDVAHVAQQLLSSRASPRWRYVLASALGAEAASLHEWLPWLVALHDIGKVSASFQSQNGAQKQRLLAAGFDFGGVDPRNHLHHTIVGRLVLADALPAPLPERLFNVLRYMVSGHHGEYNRSGREERRLWNRQHEPEEWGQLRRRAVELLTSYLLLAPAPLPEPGNLSAAIALLNGFTILCDWLGSDGCFFIPSSHVPLVEYVPLSRHRARKSAEGASFFIPSASGTPPRFDALFSGWRVRPLQTAAEQIPGALLRAPSLTVAEAPTGEGKTEFALTLARRIGALRGTDEMYVALPSMATSNAMFPRIQEHLRDRLGLDPATVKLLHGQAFLVEDDLRIVPLESGEGTTPPSLAWFSPRKRALLAPFGVGTIDQAMYIALNTRHNALRLAGLAGKTVILDEVHAYDTYMTTIIERLLEWLGQAGTSVILLSATLPMWRRQRLLEAFAGHSLALDEANSDAYPSVITVGRGSDHAPAFLAPPAHTSQKRSELRLLHYGDKQAAEKAAWLLAQVAEGGCACWIANTVQRAQDIFRALQQQVQAAEGIDLTLLHARFPLEERQAREREVLERYGKDGARPARGIVVGTQLLEQSLDVDFDVMASDHAPVDLLLQREGRLHRHARHRPAAHDVPRLYINAECDADGTLLLGADRFYSEYIMRRSWRALQGKEALHLPADYRPLVEFVYDEAAPEDPTLAEAYDALLGERNWQSEEALWRVIQPPDADSPFCDTPHPLFDEEEDSAAWIVAQTRLGRESLTVIPLERSGAAARLVPLDEAVALEGGASREQQFRLLGRAITISHPVVVQALKRQSNERPPLFTDSPLLRHVHPLWLEGGRAVIAVERRMVIVTLDEDLGLLFDKGESV